MHIHFAAQDEPRHRDGSQQIVFWRLGPIAHGNRSLGAKILHNHFLNVAVLLVYIADGKESIHSIILCLADTDQNPGGEGNLLLAGLVQHLQSARGNLVWRMLMSASRVEQSSAGGFQHEAEAGRDGSQPVDPRSTHQSWIRMR